MTRRQAASSVALLGLLAVALMSLSAPSKASHDNGRGVAWGPSPGSDPGWSLSGVGHAIGASQNFGLFEVFDLLLEIGAPDHP